MVITKKGKLTLESALETHDASICHVVPILGLYLLLGRDRAFEYSLVFRLDGLGMGGGWAGVDRTGGYNAREIERTGVLSPGRGLIYPPSPVFMIAIHILSRDLHCILVAMICMPVLLYDGAQ